VARRLIAIVGPTASGKSALALRLARECACEIVSCDSLQVYRGLDIGSAKPTREERASVPHHLIDVVEPDEDFSAADYARLARAAIAEIAGRGRLPLVVGGTGLYLRALLEGLFEGPSRDQALRGRLEALAERHGDARLHRLLRHVDPEAAARLPPTDRLRIVRALEVYWLTGRPLSDHHREQSSGGGLEGFAVLVLGLEPSREVLREAVERRTRQMLAAGLVEEVRRLLARGYGPELRPLRAIGYRQATLLLQGRSTEQQAQRDIVTETMRYAKRQRTWFRHQAQVVWCPDADAARERALTWLAASEVP
jgi:tRNA dimethylallyltransferase